MSRSDRSIVAALIGCLILAGLADYDSSQQHQTEHHSAPYQSITTATVVKPAISTSNPEAAKTECPDEHRGNADCTVIGTQAAIDQARYAHQQATAAIFGVIFGALTLIAAFLAAKWAKAAAKHTEAGAREARRSADAADRANVQSAKIGQAQVRAYMSCTKAKIGLLENGDLLVFCTVRNFGQSPARGVTCQPDINYFRTAEEDFTAVQKDRVKKRRDIPAGAEHEFSLGHYTISVPEALTDKTTQAVLITVFVSMDGTDVFDEPIESKDRLTKTVFGVPAGSQWIELEVGDETLIIKP